MPDPHAPCALTIRFPSEETMRAWAGFHLANELREGANLVEMTSLPQLSIPGQRRFVLGRKEPLNAPKPKP